MSPPIFDLAGQLLHREHMKGEREEPDTGRERERRKALQQQRSPELSLRSQASLPAASHRRVLSFFPAMISTNVRQHLPVMPSTSSHQASHRTAHPSGAPELTADFHLFHLSQLMAVPTIISRAQASTHLLSKQSFALRSPRPKPK